MKVISKISNWFVELAWYTQAAMAWSALCMLSPVALSYKAVRGVIDDHIPATLALMCMMSASVPYLVWLQRHSNMFHIQLRRFDHAVDRVEKYDDMRVLHRDMVRFYKANVTTKAMGDEFRIVYMKLKLKIKANDEKI
jgi:hypothetical protein